MHSKDIEVTSSMFITGERKDIDRGKKFERKAHPPSVLQELEASWIERSGSVLHLLSLLAVSVRNIADKSVGVGGQRTFAHNSKRTSDTRVPAGASRSQISRLHRVYNILLFGAPSHAELEEEEESCDIISTASTVDEGVGETSVLDLVSLAVFRLRRARRFDPANALEALVDGLLKEEYGNGGGGDGVCARTLRLLFCLSRPAVHHDVEDWEVLGEHGRRALQTMYGYVDAQGIEGEPFPGLLDTPANANLTADRRGFGYAPRRVAAMFFRCGEAHRFAHEHSDDLPQPREADAGAGAFTSRYMLPDDCVLHGDTCISGGRPDAFRAQRMPWFTDASFCSNRGLPSLVEQGFHWQSQDLAGMVGRSSISSRARLAGCFAWHTPAPCGVEGGGPDLSVTFFGALRRGWMDQTSDSFQDLRLTFSIPELGDRPTYLTEEAQASRRAANPHVTPPPCSPTIASTFLSPPVAWHSRNDHGIGRRIPGGRRSRSRVGGGDPEMENPSQGGLLQGPLRQCPMDSTEAAAGVRLMAQGWERVEAGQEVPVAPRWALAPSPLVTCERTSAFDVCFREYFGGASGAAEPATVTTAEVSRRALAALQGLPSASFGFDPGRVAMVPTGLPELQGAMGMNPEPGAGGEGVLRTACLSPAALASTMEEFARAGTWFRRVEALAHFFAESPKQGGQVAQSFAADLRGKVALLQARVLGIAQEIGVEGRGEGDGRVGDISVGGTRGGREEAGLQGSGCKRGGRLPEESATLTLPDLLVRTGPVRRAMGVMAELCLVVAEDLRGVGGMEGVLRSFPRGSGLLTHLFREASAREVVACGVGGGTTVRARVLPVGGWDSGGVPFPGYSVGAGGAGRAGVWEHWAVRSLLCSAAGPYLSMLSRWLWSGELKAIEDPYQEFPVCCKEEVSPLLDRRGGFLDRQEGQDGGHARWARGGGVDFMSAGFRESEGAGVPCFLKGGIMGSVIRAGKFLRMLKLSSREFYRACALAPPPPLGLVFNPSALASRLSTLSRLCLVQEAGGHSAAREVRSRRLERALGVEEERGRRVGAVRAEEEAALRMLEVQRDHDRASFREANRLWVKGLERDRLAASAAATSATVGDASVLGKNKDSNNSNGDGRLVGGGGMLSFLDPPTSEAEERAMEALRERYRRLEGEADARMLRARWRRKRVARIPLARAALKVLRADESELWATEAAPGAAQVIIADGDVVKGDAGPGEAGVGAGARGGGHGHVGPTREEPVGPADCTEPARGVVGTGTGDHRAQVKVMHEPGGGSSSGVSRAFDGAGAGGGVGSTRDSGDLRSLTFVKVTQEPGGSSGGMAGVLEWAKTGEGDNPRLGQQVARAEVKQGPRGSSSKQVSLQSTLNGGAVPDGGERTGESCREAGRSVAGNMPQGHDGQGEVTEDDVVGFHHVEADVRVAQDQRQNSAGVSQALGVAGAGTGGKRFPQAEGPTHIKVTQEPGGNSSGTAHVLDGGVGWGGARNKKGDGGSGGDDSDRQSFHVRVTQDPGGSSWDMAHTLGGLLAEGGGMPQLPVMHVKVTQEPGGDSEAGRAAVHGGGSRPMPGEPGAEWRPHVKAMQESGGSSNAMQSLLELAQEGPQCAENAPPSCHSLLGSGSGKESPSVFDEPEAEQISNTSSLRGVEELGGGELEGEELKAEEWNGEDPASQSVVASGSAAAVAVVEAGVKQCATSVSDNVEQWGQAQGGQLGQGLGHGMGPWQRQRTTEPLPISSMLPAVTDPLDVYFRLASASLGYPRGCHGVAAGGGVAGQRQVGGGARPGNCGAGCEGDGGGDPGEEVNAEERWLPLEVVLRRCVLDPVLGQCQAVDSAALAYMVLGAGVGAHLTALRTFLLGMNTGFLHDFSLRLLEGLLSGSGKTDWLRSSSLEAAFVESASTTGLETAPLFDTFGYRIDLPPLGAGGGTSPEDDPCRSGAVSPGPRVVGKQSSSPLPPNTTVSLGPASPALGIGRVPASALDPFSPEALSFISPVLTVRWPLGVLLPPCALHTYVSVHRALFRHHLAMHRLRGLRLALRDMDAMGPGGREWRLGLGREREQGQRGLDWQWGRLHWLHLFRHEMQHMADCLQGYFIEQAEIGWPSLCHTLSTAGTTRGSVEDTAASVSSDQSSTQRGGGLATLTTAHARYISGVGVRVFLGDDPAGAKARARIEEFYGVVCGAAAVVASSPSQALDRVLDPPLAGSGRGKRSEGGSWAAPVLPDHVFAVLVAEREKFEALRRGLCEVLEVEAAGSASLGHMRSLNMMLGYSIGMGNGGVRAHDV